MTGAFLARRWLPALVLCLLAGCASSQTQELPVYTPSVGQAGKDVVWVPSPEQLVEKMLDLAKVTPRDALIDLGSGDGRTVIAAAKRGVKSLGIEYNPDMVALSRQNAEKAGVSRLAEFVKADIFASDLSRATVITMFLLPDLNLKLRPAILSMKPGTRIVSNTFTMGEWTDDETADLGCGPYCTAHLWIVPAKVAGVWQSARGALSLQQTFQMVSGTLGTAPISNGKLRGTQISFAAGGIDYSGNVNGNTIEGTFKSASGSGNWNARR